ncbi:Eyes absent-like protein 4 [Hordeum vulgare]|nr:Eyes absent-like protein 4 [Hordeum vulgare]
MNDDLDAAAGLASLASSDKGKPRTVRKAVAPKPKKVLTPEQRAKESTKRKDQRHATDARDEAIAAAAAQQQVTNARVATAMREALCMLGLSPSQHGLVNAVVAAAVSIGSSAFPWTVLPNSPGASACNPVSGFHVYPQTRADQLSGAPNLFDGMSVAADDDYMQNMIFEDGVRAAGFDPGETQSQDGRGAFTLPAGYNEDQAAFMHDQVGLDLDGFPLDHEFLQDYGLEEEDECDIEAEPLFQDELANQADGTKPKRKSKRTKAYTAAEDKLFVSVGGIGQDPKTGVEQKHSTFWIRVHREFHERKKFSPYQIVFQALEAFMVQHNGKCFNLFHWFMLIKDEEKFNA